MKIIQEETDDPISPSSSQYINPMDINSNYSEEDNPLALKADFILSLCELIVGGKEGLQPVEKTVIDRCVHQVYQKYFDDPVPENMPVLEDLYDVLLRQEENNLIMVDRKMLKNPNGLILGTPGSGKSFSAKREITNAFLVTDDDIIICDPEAEYSPLVNRLKGQVIKIVLPEGGMTKETFSHYDSDAVITDLNNIPVNTAGHAVLDTDNPFDSSKNVDVQYICVQRTVSSDSRLLVVQDGSTGEVYINSKDIGTGWTGWKRLWLPTVSASDSGKFLRVSAAGSWEATSLTDANTTGY